MKSNHFLFFALIIMLFSSCHLIAMKPVSPIVIKPIAAASDYYTKANLEALRSQGLQNHAPLMMLIDQEQIENPSSPALQALSLTLDAAIKSYYFPILLSASLLYNLKERFPLIRFNLQNSDWELYDVPQSQFLLLVPKEYLEINPNHGLQLNSLPNISNLLPTNGQITRFDSLDNIFNDKKGKQFNRNDLTKIFIDKKENQTAPIFDIWIYGHGMTNSTIAGLSPKQINEMLRFFDEHINTGVVNLLSCYIGGKNISLLQFEESGVARTHNYILIIDGITENVTYSSPETIGRIMFDFFTNAASLSNRGEALSRLLKDLNTFHENTGSAHGAENIPQMWLPNGLGFQTFNIDERILVIGNVLAKIHEENKTPIIAKNKEVVLVYPSHIKASMHVGLGSFKATKWSAKIWKKLPMLIDDPFLNELIAAKNSPSSFSELINTFGTVKKIITNIEQYSSDDYLFPAFIPMQSEFHRISEIKLDNTKFPIGGVIKFIRDAFLSMPERKSTSVYLIDTLTGYNDISSLLMASRLYSKTTEHPLEVTLRPFVEKEITLEKVTINTNVYGDSTIMFKLNNKGWIFHSYRRIINGQFWNFEEWPADVIEEGYQAQIESSLKNETISQKPISETLKQKQEDILRKEARALKIHAIVEAQKKAGKPLPAVALPQPAK